jgi:hypothetical protein
MTVPIQIRVNQMDKRLTEVERILEETQAVQNRTNEILLEHAKQHPQYAGAINYLAMVVADLKKDE